MKVLTFEKELAARMQTRFALAVTSGTAALTTALAALGVGPGDEVILPALSWYSCFNSIVMHGALPVFAESDESLNVDPADLEVEDHAANESDHGRPRTGQSGRHGRHHGSRPADVASRSSRTCTEPRRQLQGQAAWDRLVISAFTVSRSPRRSAPAKGEAVVTNDPLLFERASRYHDLGLLRPPHEQILGEAAVKGMIGSQYRMSEFTGGVLLAQIQQARHDHWMPCAATPESGVRGTRRCAQTCTCAIGPIPRAISARASGSVSIRQSERDMFLAAMRARKRAGEGRLERWHSCRSIRPSSKS